jgi:hypothetical protein
VPKEMKSRQILPKICRLVVVSGRGLGGYTGVDKQTWPLPRAFHCKIWNVSYISKWLHGEEHDKLYFYQLLVPTHMDVEYICYVVG